MKERKNVFYFTAIPGLIPRLLNTRCSCFHFALGLANNTAFLPAISV